MAPSDSVDKSFLFISSASLPKPEYRAESICLQHEYPQDAFQKLSKNELKPQAVLLADYQELSAELMKLLSSLNIPVIIYTPVYIQEAKEMALKVRADDYLSGPIDADFIEYVEFLKKIKSYKRKNIRVVKKGSLLLYKGRPVTNLMWLKRFFDIILSLTALLLLLPILTIIAIVIKLESKGSFLYISKRSGVGYRVFDFYKFRSMRDGADAQLISLEGSNQYTADDKNAVFFKIKNDPRVTKFGQFLRDTSLDELPQLINVLKGDMSLVGNRPLPLYEAEKLTRDQTALRFMAPAGITGLWQVTKRGKKIMSPQERIQLDVEYASVNSFLYDLKIILRTFPALLQKEKV